MKAVSWPNWQLLWPAVTGLHHTHLDLLIKRCFWVTIPSICSLHCGARKRVCACCKGLPRTTRSMIPISDDLYLTSLSVPVVCSFWISYLDISVCSHWPLRNNTTELSSTTTTAVSCWASPLREVQVKFLNQGASRWCWVSGSERLEGRGMRQSLLFSWLRFFQHFYTIILQQQPTGANLLPPLLQNFMNCHEVAIIRLCGAVSLTNSDKRSSALSPLWGWGTGTVTGREVMTTK